jgi:hypothetical protein
MTIEKVSHDMSPTIELSPTSRFRERALLATSLLVAAFLAPEALAAERSAACTSILVGAPDAPAATTRRSRKKPAFSASQILDLELSVTLSRAARDAGTVDLKIYTPKGHLYQTITVPVASDEAKQNESSGRRQSKRSFAVATLPVAGTTIVTSSLYGTWRVEAHLDGGTSPCGRAQQFTIEP